MLLENNKAVVIHSRKVAGTSLRDTLKLKKCFVQEDHSKLFDWGTISISQDNYLIKINPVPSYIDNMGALTNCINKAVASEFKIYLPIRNPFERAVSGYLFYKNVNKYSQWNAAKHVDFNAYIKILYTKEKYQKDFAFRSHSLMSYLEMITLKSGERLAYNTIRFESLEKDFLSMCEEVGIKNNEKILNLNKNKPYDYKDFYNDFSKKIVTRVYEEDLDIFKYTW
jgi:hypothetical protein